MMRYCVIFIVINKICHNVTYDKPKDFFGDVLYKKVNNVHAKVNIESDSSKFICYRDTEIDNKICDTINKQIISNRKYKKCMFYFYKLLEWLRNYKYAYIQTCYCKEVSDEGIVDDEIKEGKQGDMEQKVLQKGEDIEKNKEEKPKSSADMIKSNDILKSAYMVEEKQPSLTFMQKLNWMYRIVTGREKRLPPSEIAMQMLKEEEDKTGNSNGNVQGNPPKNGPTKSGQAPTEPAKDGQAATEPAKSGQDASGPAKDGQDPKASESAKDGKDASETAKDGQDLKANASEPAKDGQEATEPAKGVQAATEPAKDEPKASEPAKGGQEATESASN